MILSAVCKLARRQVDECAVGAVCIVVTPPRFDDRFGVVKRQELMDVQELGAGGP
jgi:hypothetical protein